MTHFNLTYKAMDDYKPCGHGGWPENAIHCHLCGRAIKPNAAQLAFRVEDAALIADETYGDSKSWSNRVTHSDILKYANAGDEMTWYDFDIDMKHISACCPGVLFILKGNGEAAGDVWIRYYLNGKVQVEEIEIKLDKFDPSKLE